MAVADPSAAPRRTRTERVYLELFRPLAPALTTVAFLVAWLVTDNRDLRDVAIGTTASVVAGVVYLLLARRFPPRRVIAASLVLDELLVVGLVLQLPEPTVLGAALLWSVALAGIFLGVRAVLAMTAFAVGVFLLLPTLSGVDASAAPLITEAIIIVVIGCVLAFARREELLLRAELHRSRRQLNEAQRVAAIGSWEWHPRTNTLAWSDETYRLMGLDRSAPLTVESFRANLDADEVARMQAAITRTLERDVPYDIDLRFRRPGTDGEPGVLRARGTTMVDDGERWFVGTAQDVTELRRVEAQQAEFVATASHELRTPTTIIAGFASTLHDRWDTLGDEERRSFVGEIATGAERLTTRIEDVLHVSRIESGRLRIQPSRFDLGASIEQAVAAFADRGVQVTYDAPAAALHVRADEQRIRQVVDNLLENATRYARSTVHVTCEPRDGDAVVTIGDDGPGIAPEHRERVFERFTRLEPAGHSTPGTGLGLYIAKELVERSGGSMGAGDSAIGGAAVWFALVRDPDGVADV